MNKNKKRSIATIACCLLAGYLIFQYAYQSILLDGMNDYASHTHTIIPLFRMGNWTKGWMTSPHCLWHLSTLLFYNVFGIPMDIAAALVTSLYTMLYYLILVWTVKRVLSYYKYEVHEVVVALLCLGFCYVQSISISWSDAGEAYLGAFSMNPLHSPTHLCMRGFALLCFCLAIDLLQGFGKEDYENIFFQSSVGKQRVYLTVFLFLSVVMKPTFAEMFIPAVAFYMLGVWICRVCKKNQPGEYFRSCLWMLLCATPALIYMLIQYIVFFALGNNYGEGGALIITQWLEVWHMFSTNVALAIVFGMAFPLYMICIDIRYFLKEIPGRIALIGYGIAFLEAAFLGEEGSRMDHANFLWPYMAAMQIVWVVAFWRLLVLEKREDKTKLQSGLLLAGWVLFFLHVLFGYILYQYDMAELLPL